MTQQHKPEFIAFRCSTPVKSYSQGQVILVHQEEFAKSQLWFAEFFDRVPWLDAPAVPPEVDEDVS